METKPKIDVSSLPFAYQIALQRFQKLAAARQARLTAFIQAQPTTPFQSSRREAILEQIKTKVDGQTALTSKVAEHYANLKDVIASQGKIATEGKPAVVEATTAPSRKKTSTAD